jgi:hypothetical protein
MEDGTAGWREQWYGGPGTQDPCAVLVSRRGRARSCKAHRKAPYRPVTALLRPPRAKARPMGPSVPGSFGRPLTPSNPSWDLARSPDAGRFLRWLLRCSLTHIQVRSLRSSSPPRSRHGLRRSGPRGSPDAGRFLRWLLRCSLTHGPPGGWRALARRLRREARRRRAERATERRTRRPGTSGPLRAHIGPTPPMADT